MKEEVKEVWVAALRSGDYQQGKARLRFEDNFCCLGVLCDLYQRAKHLDRWYSFPTDDGAEGRYEFLGKIQILPEEVQQWAGIDAAGMLPGGRPLSQINDAGTPFEGIADLIDQYL